MGAPRSFGMGGSAAAFTVYVALTADAAATDYAAAAPANAVAAADAVAATDAGAAAVGADGADAADAAAAGTIMVRMAMTTRLVLKPLRMLLLLLPTLRVRMRNVAAQMFHAARKQRS